MARLYLKLAKTRKIQLWKVGLYRSRLLRATPTPQVVSSLAHPIKDGNGKPCEDVDRILGDGQPDSLALPRLLAPAEKAQTDHRDDQGDSRRHEQEPRRPQLGVLRPGSAAIHLLVMRRIELVEHEGHDAFH